MFTIPQWTLLVIERGILLYTLYLHLIGCSRQIKPLKYILNELSQTTDIKKKKLEILPLINFLWFGSDIVVLLD